MSYLKPTLAAVGLQEQNASCCTPLFTVNLGRVVIGGACTLPRGTQGVCVTSQVGTVCLAGTGG